MMKNTAYDFNTCMHVPVAQCVELCNVNYLHLQCIFLYYIELRKMLIIHIRLIQLILYSVKEPIHFEFL